MENNHKKKFHNLFEISVIGEKWTKKQTAGDPIYTELKLKTHVPSVCHLIRIDYDNKFFVMQTFILGEYAAYAHYSPDPPELYPLIPIQL